eukprot:CAMPEP_0177774070 /NCGR_PEP_ID=MMETSP0491_2-20121128/13272_1 /TAXON_ID=63592 /ORGANISM="Tetraselmis chuii, Strain PLY429" /LENGTH=801 /DNA_ID=CAMNT_0019292347 /DNA_START=110 /DNA_END=2516 /DNA_ORIENTATION=+
MIMWGSERQKPFPGWAMGCLPSPKGRAAVFLVILLGVSVPPESCLSASESCSTPSSEQDAAMELAEQLRLQSAEPELLASWKSERRESVCSWDGKTATGTAASLNYSPSWLARFSSLSALFMKGTMLTGELPSGYSALQQLREVALSGTLPPEYSNLRHLQTLLLSSTLLGGPLPPEWSALEALDTLDIAYAAVTGRLPPEWSHLSRTLVELNLRGNLLASTLPAEYSAMGGLNQLLLDDNNLEGSLPTEWHTLSGLKILDLSNNKITGTIPQSWSSMTNLERLSLHGNSLSYCGEASAAMDLPENIVEALSAASTVQVDPLNTAQNCPRAARSIVPWLLLGVLLPCVATTVLFVLGVIIHRITCHNPSCIHRHPGLFHPLAGHFGLSILRRRGKNCSWCDCLHDKPDLHVNYAELKPLVRESNYIAGGSFGSVYRAHWRGQDVAIKEIIGDVDRDVLDDYVAEVESSRKYAAKCKYIVPLLGASASLPKLYLISKFMEGGTLHHRIHGQEGLQDPMSLAEVLCYAKDIANGLVALHPTYAHRDLKPENILLDGKGRAMISDLGLGRPAACLEDEPRGDSCVSGTAAYMAPEQIDGMSPSKVDIFALGVIINECLAGEVPFSNYNSALQIQIAVAERGERPKLAAGLPPKVQRLIELCWDGDYNRRPAAWEVVHILDALILQSDVTWLGRTTQLVDTLHRRLRERTLGGGSFPGRVTFTSARNLTVESDASAPPMLTDQPCECELGHHEYPISMKSVIFDFLDDNARSSRSIVGANDVRVNDADHDVAKVDHDVVAEVDGD